MPNVGPMELIIVLVVALLIIGPKKLPEVGRSVGRSIREFKGSVGGGDDERDELVPATTDRTPVREADTADEPAAVPAGR